VKARDKNRIKQALKNGADITAVILACETGDLDIVKKGLIYTLKMKRHYIKPVSKNISRLLNFSLKTRPIA
jgi:hypothetical protein